MELYALSMGPGFLVPGLLHTVLVGSFLTRLMSRPVPGLQPIMVVIMVGEHA